MLSQLKKCITQDVQKITAEIVRLQAALRFARQETLLARVAYERVRNPTPSTPNRPSC